MTISSVLTPPAFRLRTEPAREVVLVAPEGELDLHTVPQLAAAVDELRDVGFDRIRLDLRGLSFIDSSAIHYILQLAASQSDSFVVSVIQGPAAVRRAFSLAEVEQLIPFEDHAPPRVQRQ